MNIPTELLEVLQKVESPEALLTLAAEHNLPVDQEQAQALFNTLHQTGELADDELENVSGGGCGNATCPKCGTKKENRYYSVLGRPLTMEICPKCNP